MELPYGVAIVDGNILTVDSGVIAHCVGADLTFGKGLAKLLNKKYEVKEDCREVVQDDPAEIGMCISTPRGDVDLWNLVTKKRSGVPANLQLRGEEPYEAIYTALTVSEDDPAVIHCPYLLGCGLDGLDPQRVIDVLGRVALDRMCRILLWHNE